MGFMLSKILSISARIYTAQRSLTSIVGKLVHMSKQMDDLQTAVTANGVAIDSGISLLNGLSDQIRATAGDPAAAVRLADELKAKADQLTAAVLANTPAEQA